MSGSIPEDPSADEPESHAERFFSVMRSWGLAETILDQCILAIMRRHEPKPYRPYPKIVEKKLEYLAEMVGSVPALGAAQEWAAKADRIIMDNKGLRNIIVHAGPIHYEPNGTVHFLTVQPHPDQLPRMVLKTVRPKDWDKLFEASAQALAYLTLVLFVVAPGDVSFHASNQISRERAVELTAGLPGSKALREFVAKLLASRS